MKTINLRGTEIGKGIPKIIVPIVDCTADAIVAKAMTLKGTALHMVEWRADFYEDVMDTESVMDVLSRLRTALGEIPLLFTFRTKREGGERPIDMDAYTILNKTVAESSLVDAVDVEIFFSDTVARENIQAIHRAGVIVVGSNHGHIHHGPQGRDQKPGEQQAANLDIIDFPECQQVFNVRHVPA